MSNQKYITGLHSLLNVGVVILATYMVHLELLPLAIVIALASKWRVLTSNLHKLLRNIRANACDIIVITSTVILMDVYKRSEMALIGLALFLLVWLLFIKPLNSRNATIVQAATCQLMGFFALWLYGIERHHVAGTFALLASGMIGYSAARHALRHFENDLVTINIRSTVPMVWGLLLSQLGWLAWMWPISYHLTTYLVLPQVAFLSTVLGYFALEMLSTNSRAPKSVRRYTAIKQTISFLIISVALLVLTPWIEV